MMLSVSKGNVKMGNILSISLPAVKTCRKDAPCCKDCYALRMEKRYPNVKRAYENNLNLWETRPEEFETEAIIASFNQQVFRWHVSGDIVNMEYLKMMVRVAKKNKNTKFFAFTKKFEIVNEYLKDDSLPKNLKIIFSAWEGLKMNNPFNLPEAHVVKKNGESTTQKIKNICPGHCEDCLFNGKGCWNMKKGTIVCFPKH